MRCGLCPGEGLDAGSLGTHLGAVHFCAMSALLQSKLKFSFWTVWLLTLWLIHCLKRLCKLS